MARKHPRGLRRIRKGGRTIARIGRRLIVQVAAVYRQKENSHGKVNAGIVVDAAMHTCQQCSEIVLCSR
jgi:hypothetical protein